MMKSKPEKQDLHEAAPGSPALPFAETHGEDYPVWAKFDPVWYSQHQPELIHLMAEAGYTDIGRYYEDIGCRLGHSPNAYFDARHYMAVTKAARAEIDSGKYRSAIEHFRAAPDRGDTPHWLFSENYYRRKNPDLRISDIAERFGCGYEHFLREGDKEWRQAHPFFDPDLYIANVGSSRQTVDVRDGPYQHFLIGCYAAAAHVRVSWYFDPTWYLSTYPEVVQEIAGGHWTCALEHYLCNDHPRDFNPLAEFSETYYLGRYEEVLDAVERGEYRNGYDHFLKYGASEKRSPHADIDLQHYFSRVDVQADIVSGRFKDAFEHLMGTPRQPPHFGSTVVPEDMSREIVGRTAQTLMASVARRPLDFTTPSGMNSPKVAVIMIVHNRFNLTIAALTSLRASYSDLIELHIIDSGSTDEVCQLNQYLRGADIRRFRQNIGFVEGFNDALARVRAPYLVIMNNDITIDFGSIDAALERIASEANVGAVGGKIIRSNGRLQEAGCIIWRDGSTTGYLRDHDPNIPEANFVRDVDFCSAAFLMIKTSLARDLGGFDICFRPGYFEETDFCVRLRKLGSRIIYDPAVVIRHYEFGTSSLSTAVALMGGHQETFRRKHRQYLKTQYPKSETVVALARSPQTGKKRVLLIEDRIPLRRLGTGFTRSNDIVRTMSNLGYHVTLYPIYKAVESPASIFSDFPDTVEIIYDRGLDELREFLHARPGYYDVIWIVRTHNVERVSAVLRDVSHAVPINRIILDTEAVAAVRTELRQTVLELPERNSLASAIEAEFAGADFCQRLVAVNDRDADLIQEAGFGPVEVLGHLIRPRPTPRPFDERRGLLFLGAIHDHESPNLDAVVWFSAVVLPLLEQRLPPGTEFTIAGYINQFVDLTPLTEHRCVRLVGAVKDLADIYDQNRLFVAPLRYAAGISYKLDEAAAFGLPIVGSDLLGHQLGWTDRRDMLMASTSDPQRFADLILEAYSNPDLWNNLRANGLQRCSKPDAELQYSSSIRRIIEATIDMEC